MLHPVHFSKQVTSHPTQVCVHDRKLVLWRGANNSIACLPDVCPHRGAELSKGAVHSGELQCPYHGWKFNSLGKCTRVPQAAKGQYIPRACNAKPWTVIESAGVVWVAPSNPDEKAAGPHKKVREFSSEEAFVTDYVLDANYSYDLQIENLLDPAHIHFVHHGFQGNERKAGYIKASEMVVNDEDMTISGTFTHTTHDVPVIHIVFHWPSVVDVSIFNVGGKIMRKNIIFVTPIANDKCRVLFRDVAMKKFLAPPFAHTFLNTSSVEDVYQVINSEVVAAIMKQDIDILESQQSNTGSSKRYLLLTESDRMIVEYIRVKQKWIDTTTGMQKDFYNARADLR